MGVKGLSIEGYMAVLRGLIQSNIQNLSRVGFDCLEDGGWGVILQSSFQNPL